MQARHAMPDFGGEKGSGFGAILRDANLRRGNDAGIWCNFRTGFGGRGDWWWLLSAPGFTSAGGGVIYTASKHAVIGIMRQLAVELGPHVRVNGVAPGGTMTDLRSVAALQLEDRSQFAIPGARERIAAGNPLQMALEPADLAGAYVFLASRANARGITGSIVSVDAGSTLRMPRQG